MKTTVDKLSDTRVKLTVNVPFAELDKEIDQAYSAIAQQVQIPGFRKGKAPRQLIDARFGRGAMLEQVVNDMLPSRYEQAVNENDLKVIGQPNIDIPKVEDNDFVEFTAEVDVRPEIEIPDFSKISVTVPALAVSDEDVENELNELAERFGELKDTKRKLKTGDFAIIDIDAEVDGEKVSEVSTEGLSYRVGDDDLIKGLDTALRGMKSEEDNEFSATIESGEHKDKEATIKVHVQQTKERKLPELDDEFAQMASEFDTIEELRENTKTGLEESKKNDQAVAVRDEVLKAALAEVSFELPQSVVDEQVHAQLHQILGEMAHDDAALTRLLEAQGTTREEFDKESRESAEESVRTQLFLDTLADVEEPEVSQQELSDHILFTAQSYGMDPNQFIQQISSNGQIGNLFSDVRRGKALAAAICRVEAKDDEGNAVDVEQYFGEEDANDSTADTAADESKAEETSTDEA
ncbi:trigger factor [Corynebacterium ammoniagenes]|uniref:Trigger factor n=2 Tax=Corynebacterium ammoniagenes TaxID=1697 RepID=A0AAV5GBC4_CORAM|nr:trigger factor [Corynebacterium ammoniagenes]APT83270.1 trigger factor [Corynebacterium ammoniagenes DSM 20306]AQS74289.1 trigger factor [Corynebacterium ammoniagenes]EFG81486.1 trigger factor [Corynebacterium ammoniagenes DSM 20306]NMF32863.1 trigger factor [Corynebacterium ammoniagenes]GJN43570.1 trigger factor [Corynebacterium ammoniagenes]